MCHFQHPSYFFDRCIKQSTIVHSKLPVLAKASFTMPFKPIQSELKKKVKIKHKHFRIIQEK